MNGNAAVGTVSDHDFRLVTNSTEKMRITNNGNVGIGTTVPQSLLAVNGTITSKEVVVTETGWSDFVFAPNYALPSLEEVEQYINTHKHLPDVPSEKEVKENGLSLGKSDAVLLQKVEELTLYEIERNKEVKSLKEQAENFKSQVSGLQEQNESLMELLKAQQEAIEQLKKEVEELKK